LTWTLKQGSTPVNKCRRQERLLDPPSKCVVTMVNMKLEVASDL
jgi:hypothetical protein